MNLYVKIILVIIFILLISSEVDRNIQTAWNVDHYYQSGMPIIGLYNNIIRITHPSHIHKFDANNFKNHYIIKSHWKEIQEESLNLYSKKDKLINMRQLYEKGFASIDTELDQWKVFVIKWYDKPLENAKRLCPKTTKVIEECSDIHVAMFSILEPGKYIPPHKGPSKGCLRYHLGLKIPKDKENCYIKVNDEKFHWEEGEALVFDDTYTHSVYNNTEEPRIILFIDIERPMNYPLNKINSFLNSNASIANFIKDTNSNAEQVKELFHN